MTGEALRSSKVSEQAETTRGEAWERALCARARAGDADAFGELLQHYEARVFSLVLRWVQVRDDARELTQETFLIAFREQHRFDAARPFRPWLFKIAINACRNYKRRHRPQSGLVADDISSALWSLNPKDAEATAIAADDAQLIRAAMQRLSDEERNLLLLRYFEEMPYEELATVYGRPVTLLKVRVHRALKRLQHYVEKRR